MNMPGRASRRRSGSGTSRSEIYTGDGPVSYWNATSRSRRCTATVSSPTRASASTMNNAAGPRDAEAAGAARRTSSASTTPAPVAGSFDAAAARAGPGGVRRRRAAARRCHVGRRAHRREHAASCTRRPRSARIRRTRSAARRSCTARRRCAGSGTAQLAGPVLPRRQRGDARRRWSTHYVTLFQALDSTDRQQKRDLVEYLKTL